MIIGPQVGPQTTFLSTSADIAIYGGAAGGGKSWALLAEPLRHIYNPEFGGVIFRRTSTQVRNEGGLWDESMKLYPLVGGSPIQHILQWRFLKKAKITFAHLDHDNDVLDWQGSAIPYMGFDELTHFSEQQFLYMLSRNRSTCGIRPYVRATTNPDADSWVAELISWWIDQDTGYAIPERSGVIRWFYRNNDVWHWYDSKGEAEAANPELSKEAPPKSLTFIAATLDDNPLMLQKDPGYRANLMALNYVDRERLLGGNWKVRKQAGTIFQRQWMTLFVDAAPDPRHHKVRSVRYWDQASSLDGDDSSGGHLLECEGKIYINDVISGKWTWQKRNSVIETTAEMDESRKWLDHKLWVEQQFANKENLSILSKLLRRFAVRFDDVKKSKIKRAEPLSAAFERGEVYFVKSPWNKKVIEQLVNFPPKKDGAGVDDIVDCLSGAYNKLITTEAQQATSLPQGGRATAATNPVPSARGGGRMF